MTVAAVPHLAHTCGGAVTGATSGSSNVSLASGVITMPATTCQVAFDVAASPAGTYSNTTSGASSTETGAAGPVSNAAILTVMGAPTAAKAFSTAAIAKNEVATLTIPITNPNASAITPAPFPAHHPPPPPHRPPPHP